MSVEEEYIELMQNRKNPSLEMELKDKDFALQLEIIKNKFKNEYGIDINDEINWFNIIKVIKKVIENVNRENESERTL